GGGFGAVGARVEGAASGRPAALQVVHGPELCVERRDPASIMYHAEPSPPPTASSTNIATLIRKLAMKLRLTPPRRRLRAVGARQRPAPRPAVAVPPSATLPLAQALAASLRSRRSERAR